jgi:hypothetical protein
LILGVQSRHLVEWIWFESFRLVCPAPADELVGREAFEGLEAAGKIVCIDEVIEMLPELCVVAIVVALNSGFFDGAVHPFNLAIGPWVFDFGKPVFNLELAAHAVKDVLTGEAMTFLIDELNAVVG